MKIFFDWLTTVFRSAAPSIYSFVEVTLPYITPFPIATISSHSASVFFGLTGFAGFALVYALEGIGLVTTTKLVDTVIEAIRSRNVKSWILVAVLVTTLTVYVTILVNMNVNIHTEYTPDKAKVLTLLCYLPMIAGVLNGIGLFKLGVEKEVLASRELEEQHYQQQRLDAKEIKMAKINAGLQAATPAGTQSYPNEQPGNYRAVVMEILDHYQGNVSLTEITRLVNTSQGTHFVHDKAKGTWHKYVQAWRAQHPGNGQP